MSIITVYNNTGEVLNTLPHEERSCPYDQLNFHLTFMIINELFALTVTHCNFAGTPIP